MNQNSDKTAYPLPNFIVIGTMKGATTSLAKRLAEHPDIFFTPIKQTHFFAEDDEYEKSLNFYREYFKNCKGEKAIGEASPSYSRSKRYPHASTRIAADLPDAKLIYIIRDPIARMESQWIEARRGGWHVPPFNEAIFSPNTDILSSSLYWNELEQYRKHYPDNRILVLYTEDFRENPAECLRECYRYLEVDIDFDGGNVGSIDRPSEGATMDREWVNKYLRRSGLGKKLSQSIPRPLINALRPLVRKRIKDRPVWDLDVLSRAKEIVRADSAKILQYSGKSENFWSLKAQRAKDSKKT